MVKTQTDQAFVSLVERIEPRLAVALAAGYGPEVGREATRDALAYAWEHWDRVRVKDSSLGYVYGIGRNKARRMVRRRRPVFGEVPPQRLPDVEPGLPMALAGLPEKQRIVVILLHGYQWTMSEVAELLGTAKTTVQNHAERGMARLRAYLGVDL